MGNNCSSAQNTVITENKPFDKGPNPADDSGNTPSETNTTENVREVSDDIEKKDEGIEAESEEESEEEITDDEDTDDRVKNKAVREKESPEKVTSKTKTEPKSESNELDVNANKVDTNSPRRRRIPSKGIIKSVNRKSAMDILIAQMNDDNPGTLENGELRDNRGSPSGSSAGNGVKKHKSLSWSLNENGLTKDEPIAEKMRPGILKYLDSHRLLKNEHRLYEHRTNKSVKRVHVPFCIALQSIDDIPNPVFLVESVGRGVTEDIGKCLFQLRVSLFDITYSQFFGRTWNGPWLKAKASNSAEGRPKLNYNQNIYLHTSINDDTLLLVVELIAAVTRDDGSKDITSCGWSFFRPFRYEGDMVDLSSASTAPAQKMEVLHGSPRALLYMDEPLESNMALFPISGCNVNYTIRTHKNLSKINHLVPENVILGAKDIVPGLLEGQLDPNHPEITPDSFKKPRLQKTTPCFIEKLHLNLPPSVEKFEEELCILLNEDRMNRDNKVADGTNVEVTERRLQIGVHNGWGYVEKPEVVHLATDKFVSRRASSLGSLRRGHQRTSSAGSSREAGVGSGLVLKNRVELDNLVEDPLCTIVFILEYVIAEPLNKEERKMSMVRSQSVTIAVRWVAWAPFSTGDQNPEINLVLQGGPSAVPDACFIYKNPTADISVENHDETAAKISPGTLSFTFINQKRTSSLITPDSLMPPESSVIQRSPSIESFDRDLQETPRGKPPVPPQRDSRMETPISPMPYQQMAQSPQSMMMMQSPNMMMPPTGQMWMQGYPYPFPAGPAGYPPYMGFDNSGRYGDLQELPFNPTHTPIISASPFRQTGTGLSRAAYARLYSVGFPPILDRSGEPPDVIDPSDATQFLPVKEEMDPLQSNEVTLQFLAYSRMMTIDAAGPAQHASTVFFTFQFYRFPAVTTERLMLGDPEGDLSSDPKSMPCVLKRLDKDGTILKGAPGYQVKYYVDPTFLKPGEGRLFVNHLANQTLHVDVWDGDSLLLIGSCAVDLRHLTRQGREAVQVTYELDVFATEYGDETPSLTDDALRSGSIRPIGVNTIMKGRLHLRLANVGYPVDKSQLKDISMALHKKPPLVIQPSDDNINFFGGSLTAIKPGPTMKTNKYRAQPLAETNHELASMLVTRRDKVDDNSNEKLDPVRKRKLARMQAIRDQQGLENQPISTMAFKTDKAEKTRDLKTIELYRQHTKKDGILNMLNQAISNEYALYPTLGSTEFFEFVLKNPFNIQHTVRVHVNDPDLSVITDAREWRHFKQLNGLASPVEEGMFNTDRSTVHPEIFLRPKEQVHVPFKLVSFAADHSVQPQCPTNPFRPGKTVRPQQEKKPFMDTKVIKIQFLTEDGKPIAMLNVKVSPQPHIIDQTFRFHQPEQTFLKKSIRLPPPHTLPGAPIGGPGFSQVYVKCTDNNVICTCNPVQPGEPLDVFVKVACGPSPQVKRFFVNIYGDPYMSKPLQIWQFFVHSLQRVDVTCIEGQMNKFSLILRGTQASRLVRCYSSHPNELQISPKDAFTLGANTVQELQVGVRPLQIGSKYMFLNVVDVEYHQLIRSWLVCLTCKNPVISKAFELSLPVGGGKGSNKRIAYTNPYPYRKVFNLRTNRDDLVQFKENRAEIEPGDAYTIGLRFSPSLTPGVAEILIFINDEEDKNEETFCVKAQYN
ncbi:nephrocystin-4-like isoform X2 [Tubulanus polymorphus]|uniref:nephrocystin-4-like isoform X2 n=1 Tax=Tubulanus polymorphus TaxID=672921 RepID=UPI003DA67C22